jgi:hypothetical protein
MSLSAEGFMYAVNSLNIIENRIVEFQNEFDPPFDNLEDKVGMDHWGQIYLE